MAKFGNINLSNNERYYSPEEIKRQKQNNSSFDSRHFNISASKLNLIY